MNNESSMKIYKLNLRYVFEKLMIFHFKTTCIILKMHDFTQHVALNHMQI